MSGRLLDLHELLKLYNSSSAAGAEVSGAALLELLHVGDRHLDFENEYPQHVQNGMLRIKDLEVA